MSGPSAGVATENDLIGTVNLSIPTKPEWVAVARLTIAAIANRLPFSVEDIEDLKLAMAEACTYVIAASSEPSIDMTFETGKDFLRIRVRDRGAVRPEKAPVRPTGVSTEGLGIFLIQALMDEVEHTSEGPAGSELVMTKCVGS